MKLLKLWILFCLCGTLGFAQEVQVVDFSGKGIAGAHVIGLGAGDARLHLTDGRGWCSLASANFNALQVSAVGFESLLQPLSVRTPSSTESEDSLRITLTKAEVALGEVVITAQNAPTRREDAVHKVRVISAQEIASRGAVNVTDVLRQELNFRISNDNILGAGLSMMGISGENVKILVDGVPVIGRLDGNIDLNQLNVNEIERIEIVEGPLAVNYGTNALAGTINLISKSPKKQSINASADAFTESSGHYNLSAGSNVGGRKGSMRLQIGRNYFDGWHPGDNPFWHQRSGVADATRFQQWNPREQLFGRAAYRISGKDSYLEIGGQLFRETITNRGMPDAAYGERAFDDTYRTARSDANLKYQRPLSDNWSMHLIAAFNDFERIKNTYITDLTGVSSSLTDVASLNDTASFRTLMSRGSFMGKLGKGWELQLGYEVEVEYASGKRIVDETGRMDNYALFATAEWKPTEALTFKPGMRVTANSRYDAPIVPSLNALYRLGSQGRLRASYARGFRAPGLKELSFYFVDINHNIIGNPDLRAEHSHHFSLGYEHHPNDDKPWGYGLSAFYNDIENLITLAQINDIEYSYVNIGEQQTGGLQANLRYSKGRFDAQLGGLYTAISNRLGSRADVPGFIFTPEANANVGYTTPSGKWSTSLFYKYNGQRNFFVLLEGDEVQESTLEAFHTADVSIERRLLDDKLTLQIGSKNLFDVQNIMAGLGGGGAHSGGGTMAVGTGRTYFARIAFNLQ